MNNSTQSEEAIRNRAAIQIVMTHLHGEKLHSYGRTVEVGGGLAP